MKTGSLSLRHLKKAVLKNISKVDKNLIRGACVGGDYSLDSQGNVSADGCGESPEIAMVKAYNNFACSLGKCQWARINAMLPASTKESYIVDYMKRVDELSRKQNVQIIGGNTQILESVTEPIFSVTLMGKADISYKEDKRGIKVGDDIVFVGFAGILGVNRLLVDDRLKGRFSDRFIDDARTSVSDLLIELSFDEEDKQSIRYIHDVSDGGVYGALWQLGEHLGKGIYIDNSLIPVKQSTIEICEALDVNPYIIDGTGGVLIVTSRGDRIVDKLAENNIMSTAIGTITAEKERKVRFAEGEERTLSPED